MTKLHETPTKTVEVRVEPADSLDNIMLSLVGFAEAKSTPANTAPDLYRTKVHEPEVTHGTGKRIHTNGVEAWAARPGERLLHVRAVQHVDEHRGEFGHARTTVLVEVTNAAGDMSNQFTATHNGVGFDYKGQVDTAELRECFNSLGMTQIVEAPNEATA